MIIIITVHILKIILETNFPLKIHINFSNNYFFDLIFVLPQIFTNLLINQIKNIIQINIYYLSNNK